MAEIDRGAPGAPSCPRKASQTSPLLGLIKQMLKCFLRLDLGAKKLLLFDLGAKKLFVFDLRAHRQPN